MRRMLHKNGRVNREQQIMSPSQRLIICSPQRITVFCFLARHELTLISHQKTVLGVYFPKHWLPFHSSSDNRSVLFLRRQQLYSQTTAKLFFPIIVAFSPDESIFYCSPDDTCFYCFPDRSFFLFSPIKRCFFTKRLLFIQV